MFGLTNNAKEFQREGPLSTTADAKFIAYAISFWFFGLSLAFSHTHTGRVIFRKDTREISLTFLENCTSLQVMLTPYVLKIFVSILFQFP